MFHSILQLFLFCRFRGGGKCTKGLAIALFVFSPPPKYESIIHSVRYLIYFTVDVSDYNLAALPLGTSRPLWRAAQAGVTSSRWKESFVSVPSPSPFPFSGRGRCLQEDTIDEAGDRWRTKSCERVNLCVARGEQCAKYCWHLNKPCKWPRPLAIRAIPGGMSNTEVSPACCLLLPEWL